MHVLGRPDIPTTAKQPEAAVILTASLICAAELAYRPNAVIVLESTACDISHTSEPASCLHQSMLGSKCALITKSIIHLLSPKFEACKVVAAPARELKLVRHALQPPIEADTRM